MATDNQTDLATLRGLNFASAGMGAYGSFMTGKSQLNYGAAAEAAALSQAAQLRTRSGQVLAVTQREAINVDRQAEYTASRALAIAAASGGGASDPTVVNLIAQNAGEFAYRKAVTLWKGQEESRVLNAQADYKEFEGRQTKENARAAAKASFMKVGTSVMGGYARDSSLLQRFGGDGPDQYRSDQ